MKRILALAALGLALGTSIDFATREVALSSAEAAPTWKATLTSTDAGSTNTYVFATTQVSARLLCDIPFCYRTGRGTAIAADCAKDEIPDHQPFGNPYTTSASTMTGTQVHDGGDEGRTITTNLTETISSTTTAIIRPVDVQMANDNSIVARALDGGNPNCRVQQVYFNAAGR